MSQKMLNLLKKPVTSILLAIVFGFLVASVILLFTGYSPSKSIGALFSGIFSQPKYVSNVIIKSTPIILTGISVAFAFKTGLFNIGAEGQFIMGSVVSTVVGVSLGTSVPGFFQVPILLLSGMLAGALFGGIVGFLKSRFGIHEVITSIMLNWIAFHFSNFIVSLDAFHKPNTTGTYPISKEGFTTLFSDWKVSAAGRSLRNKNKFLNSILSTDVNVGILIAIIVAVLISVLLYKTKKGYELRAVGLNHYAAEFAGISVNRNIVQAMLISGAISGLAAALTITGMEPHNISTMATFENNGFNGMSVALIAQGSPIGCIFAGLLFGGLIYGGRAIQANVGAPSEIINIMTGTIVFFVALTSVIPFIIKKYRRRGAQNASTK